MSASGKTTNYELGIYVGTDITDWLGTFNGNMNKIDTQMKVNANSSSTAMQEAGSAKTIATNAESEVNELNKKVVKNSNDISDIKQKVNTNTSNISTALQNASAAQNTANSAITKINSVIAWKKSVINAYNGGTITVCWCPDMKVCTIYGRVTSKAAKQVIPTGTTITVFPDEFFTDMGIVSDRVFNQPFTMTCGSGEGSGMGYGHVTLRLSDKSLILTYNDYNTNSGGSTWSYNTSQFLCFI